MKGIAIRAEVGGMSDGVSSPTKFKSLDRSL